MRPREEAIGMVVFVKKRWIPSWLLLVITGFELVVGLAMGGGTTVSLPLDRWHYRRGNLHQKCEICMEGVDNFVVKVHLLLLSLFPLHGGQC